MTYPWQAARAASKRPLRKPIRMHGPVGFVSPLRGMGVAIERHCEGCGYHVCSCPPKRPAAEAMGADGAFRPEPGVTYEFPPQPMPKTPAGRMELYEALKDELKDETTAERARALLALLTAEGP